jgi:hypothetical protein
MLQDVGSRQYHRGDPHPTKPEYLFYRYKKRGDSRVPEWLSPAGMEKARESRKRTRQRHGRRYRKTYRHLHRSAPSLKLREKRGSVRNRARDVGIPFSLPIQFFRRMPETCPVLGIPLSTGTNDSRPNLDRVVPKLGYVEHNCIWVSGRANRIKSDATLDELQVITRFYLEWLSAPLIDGAGI